MTNHSLWVSRTNENKYKYRNKNISLTTNHSLWASSTTKINI